MPPSKDHDELEGVECRHPARPVMIHARPISATLKRYRMPPAPQAPAGLTSRQAAELERIRARYGTTTWRQRLDSTLIVCVLGDRPLAPDPPLHLVMHADATIALAVRAERQRPGAGAS